MQIFDDDSKYVRRSGLLHFQMETFTVLYKSLKSLCYIEDDCELLTDHDVPHVETEPGGGHLPELRRGPAQAPGARPERAQHGARQHRQRGCHESDEDNEGFFVNIEKLPYIIGVIRLSLIQLDELYDALQIQRQRVST